MIKYGVLGTKSQLGSGQLLKVICEQGNFANTWLAKRFLK